MLFWTGLLQLPVTWLRKLCWWHIYLQGKSTLLPWFYKAGCCLDWSKKLFLPHHILKVFWLNHRTTWKIKKQAKLRKTKQNKTKTERTKRHATETPEKVAKLYDLRHRIRMSPLRYQEGFRTGPVLPNRDLKLWLKILKITAAKGNLFFN